jgi:hypothetical protein
VRPARRVSPHAEQNLGDSRQMLPETHRYQQFVGY